jgi:hypothetical protein
MKSIVLHYNKFENGFIEVTADCEEVLNEQTGFIDLVQMLKTWKGLINTRLPIIGGVENISSKFPLYDGLCYFTHVTKEGTFFTGTGVLKYRGKEII